MTARISSERWWWNDRARVQTTLTRRRRAYRRRSATRNVLLTNEDAEATRYRLRYAATAAAAAAATARFTSTRYYSSLYRWWPFLRSPAGRPACLLTLFYLWPVKHCTVSLVERQKAECLGSRKAKIAGYRLSKRVAHEKNDLPSKQKWLARNAVKHAEVRWDSIVQHSILTFAFVLITLGKKQNSFKHICKNVQNNIKNVKKCDKNKKCL